MQIRDIERAFAPRARREASPLRRTAEGLGEHLNRLSEEVRDGDSVDSTLKAHGRSQARGFKFPPPQPQGEEVAAAAANLDLDKEQSETLDMLKEARNLAADAASLAMPGGERVISQERLKALFMELSAKRIDILPSMLNSGTLDFDEHPLFSLATPESAKTAYNGIDEMILKYLNAGQDGAENAKNDHGAALNASEQLRDYLLSEGPAKAFARFREVNRSNVLGLLQQQ